VLTRAGYQDIARLSPRRITNEAWKQIASAATGKNKPLMDDIVLASKRGIISPRFVEEYLGSLRDKLGSFGKEGENFFEWLKSADSFLAAKSEEMSRLHAFMSGRIVGEKFFGNQGQQLFNFAQQFTERTMFLYNQAGRAQLFTGPIGSVLGLFKNWPLHYLGNLAGYMGQGFRYGNWKPLAWSMVGTGSIAGLGGIPMYGAADGLSRLMSDKSLMTNLYDYMGYSDKGAFGKAGIDSIFYGMPGWAGITFQGRAEAPTADLVRDMDGLGSVVFFDRAAAAGAAGHEVLDTWMGGGSHPGHNSLVWSKLARAFLPRTAYRAMQLTEQRALKSLNTGNPLISDVSMPQHIINSLGITPLDLQRSRDVSSEIWTKQKKLQDKISTFGKLIADPQLNGDVEAATALRRRAFLQEGLPMDRVSSSVLHYMQKRRRPSSFADLDAVEVGRARRIFGNLK